MDKEKTAEIQSKLLEMNKLIAKLDPAIRAAAFDIMVPYYFEDKPAVRKTKVEKIKAGGGASSKEDVDVSDLGSFLENFEHAKPADNVMLLVAWLYSQYGARPIQAKEIKELSDASGLVIPNRPDNTMRQAKDKGKGLFSQQGKGWKLTVSGELFVKTTYSVKKGSKSIPKD